MNWSVRADYSSLLSSLLDEAEEIRNRIKAYKKDLEDARRRLDNAPTIEEEQEAYYEIEDLSYGIETLEKELERLE